MSETSSIPEKSLTADLETCDREAIHIPGSIQPPGALLALDDALNVVHASENVAGLAGKPLDQLLNKPLVACLGVTDAEKFGAAVQAASFSTEPIHLLSLIFGGRRHHVLAHRYKGLLIAEFEPTESSPAEESQLRAMRTNTRRAIRRLEDATTVDSIFRIVAEEIRRITGFGRIMLYQFDSSWHGRVVAEDIDPNSDLESYQHHHFPSSDIPRQARELYRLNRTRLIADASYTPGVIEPRVNPVTGRPLDLTYSILRSVSPVHVEYLKNMNVAASMSISIMKDGQLWGLIACHHRTPHFVPYDIRLECDHLAQVFSVKLSARLLAIESEYRSKLAAIQRGVLASMAEHEQVVDGLLQRESDILELGSASGVAVWMSGALQVLGKTPSEDEIKKLVAWLDQSHAGDVYHTHSLAEAYPDADAFEHQASGLLAVAMPRFRTNCLLWFRPEIVQTIEWAGDPEKQVSTPGDGRIHPRKSFETWKQVVHRKSLPWRSEEIAAAASLSDSIVRIVMRSAEELSRVNTELRQINKELEAFSYSVSHDLRAPFRHIAGFSDLLKRRAGLQLDQTSLRYIDTIADAAKYAGTLVDALLQFSRMSRRALTPRPLDLTALFRDISVEVVQLEAADRDVEWQIDALPEVNADIAMMRLVVQNLLSNAVKFTRPRSVAKVSVGVVQNPDEHVIFVRDNGVGFDMNYIDKLFGVFQRFHTVEEFDGTGIGLANVKRIVERHGGRVWAEAVINEGATFYFALPKVIKLPEDDAESQDD